MITSSQLPNLALMMPVHQAFLMGHCLCSCLPVIAVAVLESTSIMVQVLNTLADIHAQVMQLDEELESSGEADIVRECQGWLQQLQSFIIALQRDMSECREAEAQGMPDALQHWQQVVQSAAAKLCKASGFESEVSCNITPTEQDRSSQGYLLKTVMHTIMSKALRGLHCAIESSCSKSHKETH